MGKNAIEYCASKFNRGQNIQFFSLDKRIEQ
jgi:hypothetical protein